MKGKWAGTAAAVFKGSIELLLYLPLFLVVAVHVLPDSSAIGWWILTLPLCYGAGFAACTILQSSRLYQMFLISILIGSLQVYLLYGFSYSFFITMPLSALAAFRGNRLVLIEWRDLFPLGYFLVGLLSYFAASLSLQKVQDFQSFMPFLLWGGIASLIIMLLVSNQYNMKTETLSGNKDRALAAAALWQNRILVLCMVLVIVIVVLFRKLQQSLFWLKEQLLAWLRELLSSIPKPSDLGQQSTGPAVPTDLPKNGPPAQWLIWLEQVFIVLMEIFITIAALALVYFALVGLVRLFKKMYLKLFSLLNYGKRSIDTSGYEDDVETLNWTELPVNLGSKLKSWLTQIPSRADRWENLITNQERMRYLYRLWVQRSIRTGYVPKNHLTPKETDKDMQLWNPNIAQTPNQLIQLYEQARYSENQIDSDAVLTIKQSLDRDKK